MRVMVGLVLGVLALVPDAPATMPDLLESYLTKYVKLEPEARTRLLGGQTVTKMLQSDPAKEVAVFGAVWVDAPIEKYLAAVHDVERFESGGSFRVTRKISAPPRREDFTELRLPAEDIADLRSCRISSCELKLAGSAIERIRQEVDWSKPDAEAHLNAIARDMAFDYVTSYLQGGNDQLAVYRDSARPTFVAAEFAGMVDRLQALSEFLPGIRRYLLEFPRATLPGSESFLYWQEVKFGLKPTIRINHLVIARDPSGATVASKMLYATHYFWTALEMRVLVRDPARGSGFWFVTESRSRSDGLSGFVGRVIRGKVRGEAEKGVAAVLRTTKETMERR
jgi:hypothetical protein